MAIIDFFDRGWRQRPAATAYVMGERSWTFGDAGRLSCRIAHALLADGFAGEAKVAVLSPNDPRAWIAVLGVWRAGLAWVPLNPRNPAEETGRLVDGFDCEVVVYHSALQGVVDEIRPGLPRVSRWVCLDAAAPDAVSLDAWTARQPATAPDVAYEMDDVVAIFPTGGTTGPPKGVMNTHRSFSVCFAHLMMAAQYPAGETAVNLIAAPMTHAAGVLSIPTSARGGTVVVIPGADPAAILAAIETHRVTELFLPPTVIYRLLETPGLAGRDVTSLRYLLYGAAPMSTAKLRRAIEAFGPVLMEVYGQVEAFAGISYLRPDEHLSGGAIAPESRLASCGRPYPLISVEIRDDDGGAVPAGTTGEICVRGDLVMKGYYKAPERTAATVVDGWLHTGDVGHLDEDGYLHITDRKRDLIISGGVNVYPSEIEQVIWAHPAVQDCVVIGAPDDDWGEAVTAVVEPNPGAQVDPAEIIALCKERLGSVRAPKRVDVVDALPRSPNGKVLKKDVRERYWAGQATRV